MSPGKLQTPVRVLSTPVFTYSESIKFYTKKTRKNGKSTGKFNKIKYSNRYKNFFNVSSGKERLFILAIHK